MQGIYNYIPETNHFSRVYSIAAVLYLQFVLHVMLFHPWNVLLLLLLLYIVKYSAFMHIKIAKSLQVKLSGKFQYIATLHLCLHIKWLTFTSYSYQKLPIQNLFNFVQSSKETPHFSNDKLGKILVLYSGKCRIRKKNWVIC